MDSPHTAPKPTLPSAQNGLLVLPSLPLKEFCPQTSWDNFLSPVMPESQVRYNSGISAKEAHGHIIVIRRSGNVHLLNVTRMTAVGS